MARWTEKTRKSGLESLQPDQLLPLHRASYGTFAWYTILGILSSCTAIDIGCLDPGSLDPSHHQRLRNHAFHGVSIRSSTVACGTVQ
ncbi:hypothetical protein Y032_0358g3408 [Ancylostoma ceylanicum]|nr:hypothetical protein Y032_0358g3408 [Ancylostoma ceylanicum]